MKILIEFRKIKNQVDFDDLICAIDSMEENYAVIKAPKKWCNGVEGFS
jgi:hypothetical protein